MEWKSLTYIKAATRLKHIWGAFIHKNQTQETHIKVNTKWPTQHLGFIYQIEDAKHYCALGQTKHCIGCLGNSLFIWKNSFCRWSDTHSAFTTMTLQNCQSFDLLNVFVERPIKIQRAPTSFNLSLLSFEFLSLSSIRKPHAGTSQCFSKRNASKGFKVISADTSFSWDKWVKLAKRWHSKNKLSLVPNVFRKT